jgi:hypothetical protein
MPFWDNKWFPNFAASISSSQIDRACFLAQTQRQRMKVAEYCFLGNSLISAAKVLPALLEDCVTTSQFLESVSQPGLLGISM